MEGLPLSDELIQELEGLAVRTSQGSFIPMEAIRKLQEKHREAQQVVEALPAPKTLHEARAGAREFLKLQLGPMPPREPTRSVAASEPQPPSRA